MLKEPGFKGWILNALNVWYQAHALLVESWVLTLDLYASVYVT